MVSVRKSAQKSRFDDLPTLRFRGRPDQLGREHHQRDLIVERWKKMGMQADDIGLIADVDETPSRDFLRAVQVCDVPHFNQSGPKRPCAIPKITTLAMVFEGGPDCITKRKCKSSWLCVASLARCSL